MNSNFKEKMKKSVPLDKDIWTQFEQIIDIPDEKFDALYDTLMVTMQESFTSQEFQQEMIHSFKTIPNFDPETEKAGLENFIKEIEEDETLSDKKKEFLRALFNDAFLAALDFAEAPRERITVEVQKLNDTAKLPEYSHTSDAGADVFSAEDISIGAAETKIVKTGLKVAIPIGYEIQIRPRSGLSAKTGLRVANAPGTIDAGYRGEVGIIITNISTEPYEIKVGDKIAQMVIAPTPMIKWKEVATISDDTDRGVGGFGSSGR